MIKGVTLPSHQRRRMTLIRGFRGPFRYSAQFFLAFGSCNCRCGPVSESTVLRQTWLYVGSRGEDILFYAVQVWRADPAELFADKTRERHKCIENRLEVSFLCDILKFLRLDWKSSKFFCSLEAWSNESAVTETSRSCIGRRYCTG